MEPEVWRKVSDIFSECLDLPATERDAFLTKLETTDPGITSEIRKLLATYGQDEEFLEKPAIQEEANLLPRSGTTSADERVVSRSRKYLGKSRWFWALQTANIIILCCYVYTFSLIATYRGTTTSLGWSYARTAQGRRVGLVEDPGPAAGILQVGDYVQEIDGKPVQMLDVPGVVPRVPYSARVLRQGTLHDVKLTLEVVSDPQWLGHTVSFLLLSLSFFLTAVVLSVMRPDGAVTRLAWAALALEGVVLLGIVLSPYEDLLGASAAAFYFWIKFVTGPHLGFAFHFYLRVFRSQRSRLSTFLIRTFYAWGTYSILFINWAYSPHAHTRLDSFLGSHLALWRALDIVGENFYLVAPIAVCAAVASSYFWAETIEDRRRASWIAVATITGIIPYIIQRIAWIAGVPGADIHGPWGVLPAALIPITSGYVILKHRLFDIHVVLRRGLQYLVARNALRFILALPLLAFLYALATNANRTVGELVLHNWVIVALVVLIVVVMQFRQRFSTWLDRRFFREGYQQERILLALIEDLRNLDSIPEMGQRVVSELATALHPENIYFFYYSPQDRAFLRGFGTDARADGLRIPEGSALPDLLSKSDHALSVESFPSEGVPLMSWSWLYTLRIDLVVPLNRADGSPVGFLLLGRKKSEEPYSVVDRKLLLGLARAMAVGCENLLLHERVLRQQRTNEEMRSRVEGMGTAWLQECPQCGRCFDCSLRACSEDGSELALSMPVHRLLEGRYRLDRVLGRGGMGTVFVATDLRLQRQVAAKLVQAGRTAHPGWLRRFNREARALARLNHENIVLTYDFGVVEDEVAYLIMEFVPGTTLRAQLEMGPVSPARAAAWFDQVLEGVKAAHAAGIVHRDLKPENLLIASSPGRERVKIADFGVAKWQAPEAESVSLTLPGTIVGSLRYMSPEQLLGQSVDARSDVFSIGVMVFEVLTGRLPFSGGSYAERMASNEQAFEHFGASLREAPDLQAVLRKCLARNADDRYSSAAALQAELIPRMTECRADFRRTAEELA